MRVIITRTTGIIKQYEHVFNIESHFDYKLGARMDLQIEGRRNRVRIPVIDIKHLSVLD